MLGVRPGPVRMNQGSSVIASALRIAFEEAAPAAAPGLDRIFGLLAELHAGPEALLRRAFDPGRAGFPAVVRAVGQKALGHGPLAGGTIVRRHINPLSWGPPREKRRLIC